MHIQYIGHNHVHDMDFKISRPNGSGNYLALLIKSPATFYLHDKVLHTPPNIFFLYKQGTPQYYEAYQQPFSNDWFHFKLASDELDYFQKLALPFEVPIDILDLPFFSLLIKQMTCEFYGDSPYKTEILDHYMRIFFLKISEAYKSKPTTLSSPHHNQLDLLRSKIYNCPYEKWNIEWLAHEITLSPYYFQKLYKKRFGVTCLHDIINARIEYAKCNLIKTDLSIKHIAEMCGYENDVHFMRQFKKFTGLTPSEFRLRYKEITNIDSISLRDIES